MSENTKETWTSRKWMTQAPLHILGFQLGPRFAEDGSQGDRNMWLLPALLLLCLSGCLSLKGPGSVTGTAGDSLTVWCQYESMYKGYNKYWCRGQYDTSCESIVETKGEEKVERNGRVSIRDHPEALAFTVTMQNLNEDDAGSYWCKIQTVWVLDSWSRDPSDLVRVYVSPGWGSCHVHQRISSNREVERGLSDHTEPVSGTGEGLSLQDNCFREIMSWESSGNEGVDYVNSLVVT
eukprot:XP_016880064.1 CMRF35-like molecule 2 isoform X1 [Homo sapiens]